MIFKILLFLFIVTPYPIYYLGNFILDIFVEKYEREIILKAFFNIIVLFEFFLLYFGFKFMIHIVYISSLGILLQIFLVISHFYTNNKIKWLDPLKFTRITRKWIMKVYFLFILIAFACHVIASAFL